MYKNIKIISIFLLVFSFATAAFGQETSGSIEITMQDTTGAAVPGVTLTITNQSGTAGFRRTVTSNDSGFTRVLQVPPGKYKVKASSTAGFSGKTYTNISVVLGKSTPVVMDLSAGTVDATVDITAGDNASIDVTDSKIQTNITSELAELLPKGVGFASLLKLSPSTRQEAKSGGYQVDGASGSENTFIVDGNEVTNALSGTLDTNNNLPFSVIQEVQVKSSAFAAEYGGALGGVINVVTKGGNNQFAGEFGINVSPGPWQGTRRNVLYDDGLAAVQLSYDGIDSTTGFIPTASLGGPIVPDRVWFYGNYSPQYSEITRTIPYKTLAPLEYRGSTKSDYAFGRIDAQPINSLRVSSTYVWNPIAVTGQVPGLTSQYDSGYPNGSGLSGVEYQDSRGGRVNSNIFTLQGVYTPTSNIVVSSRYGRNFLNNKAGTYGLPSPFPYQIGSTFYFCPSSSTPPPGVGCVSGGSNGVPWANGTVFDATVRETIEADATYIFEGGGRHEIKGGYQRNSIENNVIAPRNGYLRLEYGIAIADESGRSVESTPGAIGTGRWRRFGANGTASSTNTGLYFQDKWQPTSRLTLNLGFRIEEEAVPSFNSFPAIEFGWGDKIAPRIGGAFDLTGDGKTKISGFFGWFYDRFKYDLPRGSFGGNIFYDDYFELFDATKAYDSYDPAVYLGPNSGENTIGGNCPSTGFAYLGIRCSIDRRVASNDPSLNIQEQGGIDPNILAMRQTEISFTFERELSEKYKLSARYVRKKLDRAVEDAGFVTPSGSEAYIIGNPGLGFVKDFYEAAGYIPTTAKRKYDAVEFGLNRRFADDYYFNANYTWSRLWGNYGGLASSDENGRTDPNVSRAFDAPFTEASVSGGETVGLLGTDRPHVFKFSGAYSFNWSERTGSLQNNTTEFQTFFLAQSGIPLTTFANVAGYNSIVLFERGDMGRTPFQTQTDIAVRHRYKFGRDSRFTLVAELDVINLFDQDTVTSRYVIIDHTSYGLDDPANGLVTAAEVADPNILEYNLAQGRFQANGAPGILANLQNSTINDPDNRYNQPNGYQAARAVRFGFRFIF